ncbi:TetR/AcrR family transcriptional regulator [Bacillaceae bacterium Marseille-Q3522]|nr:TetR/AcrR family transcriptional regulator [Bacillaceae bacterium Marseille-Q3522]
MGIAERRQEEIEKIKKKIIEAASYILMKEGYEKLSIRKIADKIEYSPGIIYHYFKDKGEIIATVVENGYQKILKNIIDVPVDQENPEKSLIQGLKKYIQIMLENPGQFKAVLMNDIQEVQDKVNILEKGISKKRKSIEMLSQLIAFTIEKGKFRAVDEELTAQIIWTSTHGLIARLLLEKNISEEQKNRLIEHHFDILLHGLTK